jgi:hypothetical protein
VKKLKQAFTLRYIILSSIFIFFGSVAFAQRDELGVHIGAMNYRGDMSEFNNSSPGAAFGVFVRQNWTEAISTQYSLSVGQIQYQDALSSDPFAKARNHRFKINIYEISGQVVYNFFYFRSPNYPQIWTPYLFAGIAGFRFSPQNPSNATNSKPPYNLYQISIPFGVGVKMVVGENWNMTMEFGARKTYTDYLDDLYPNTTNRPAQYYSGNPNDKDMYFITRIGVSYTFYSKPCPRFYKLR